MAEALPEALKPVISIRGLRTEFGRQVVHDGLDLDVLPGEILGVAGGSGSGKSVLLRTILGLNRPAAGTIAVLLPGTSFFLDIGRYAPAGVDRLAPRRLRAWVLSG